MKDFVPVNSNLQGTCIPCERPRFTGWLASNLYMARTIVIIFEEKDIVFGNFPVSPDYMK